jgi:ribosomal protein S2
MRKLQISPNSDKIRPQDIDFTNLDESMSQNMQDAPRYEILKLREENQELKSQMLRLKQRQDQPLAMTTFSPVRESQNVNEN